METILLTMALAIPLVGFAAESEGPLPKVLFFGNPMESDNDVVRRPDPETLSIAERYFAELSKGVFDVTITQDGTEVSREKLARFDAVVFFTAINPPGVDKEALLEWIKEGGAFIGIHSTSNTYQNYSPFGEMLGARFDRRPWRTRENPQTKVRVKVLDRSHPATKELPTEFEIADDIYQFKDFQAGEVNLLMSIDPASVDMANPRVNRADKHLPVAWAKSYGEGRVFYTLLGDWEETWKDPRYRKHLIGGIRWAMNRTDGGRAGRP